MPRTPLLLDRVFQHLKGVPLSLLVCDEAHRIKNHKSQVSASRLLVL